MKQGLRFQCYKYNIFFIKDLLKKATSSVEQLERDVGEFVASKSLRATIKKSVRSSKTLKVKSEKKKKA